MKLIYCPNCKQYKDESLFNWRNRLKGKKQRICKTCQSEVNKKSYEKNIESNRERLNKHRKQDKANARSFINHYLAESVCADCGEYRTEVLTFDHVRGKKKMDVSQMVNHGYSINTIMSEIAKCDIVCANCHMQREKKRREANRKSPRLKDNKPDAWYKDHGEYPRWYKDQENNRNKSPLELDRELRRLAEEELLNRGKNE